MRNLRTEEEIINSWKGNIEKPLISICCITYNHELYIEDAIEGFLIQETEFPFEILIHDDASTDGTANIIREYEAKYPRLIKPIYQTKNQYSKGVRVSAEFNFPRAMGKYIALCEGDDYWTHKKKLQKQCLFLEKNKEYSLCFHSADIKFEDLGRKYIFKDFQLESRDYMGTEIYAEWIVPTASVFFKNNKLFVDNLKNKNYLYGDIIVFLSLAQIGRLWAMSDKMSVYRKHPGGIVYHKGDIKLVRKLIIHHKEIMKNFNGCYKFIARRHISKAYLGLSKRQLFDFDLRFIKSLFLSFSYDLTVFYREFKKIILRV